MGNESSITKLELYLYFVEGFQWTLLKSAIFLTKKMTRFTGSLRLLQDQRPQTGLDPFEDDSDAKIAAIARKFEEKYVSPVTKLFAQAV